MSSVSFSTRSTLEGNRGLERASEILDRIRLPPEVGTRRLRQAEMIECVRMRRQAVRQNLGYSSLPFVLCGLPVKRPASGCLLHERRNGPFVLQITGHPSYRLPWGKTGWFPFFWRHSRFVSRRRESHLRVPLRCWTRSACSRAAHNIDGLVASFQRIFGATIFFGPDTQREHAAVFHRARFNFMTEARIWYSRDPEQLFLPGECQNAIVLSDEFYREVLDHPIPTDGALSGSPAALDLFMWLSYRCFTVGAGTGTAFGGIRAGESTGQHRLRPRTQIPGEARTVAEGDPDDVARVAGADRRRWNPAAGQSGRSNSAGASPCRLRALRTPESGRFRLSRSRLLSRISSDRAGWREIVPDRHSVAMYRCIWRGMLADGAIRRSAGFTMAGITRP